MYTYVQRRHSPNPLSVPINDSTCFNNILKVRDIPVNARTVYFEMKKQLPRNAIDNTQQQNTVDMRELYMMVSNPLLVCLVFMMLITNSCVLPVQYHHQSFDS